MSTPPDGGVIEMEKVPKLVIERLQAAVVTTAHPDADVLTAFSEHTLAERERSHIVEHLARCSECREVVALALPAEEAAAVAVARPGRNVWLTWPRMRWALVAAGVVTVAAVSLQYRRSSSQEKTAYFYDVAPAARPEEARNQSASVPAAPEVPAEAKKAAPTPIPPSPSQGKNQSKEFDRLEEFSKLATPSKDKKAVGGPVSGGAVQGDSFHGQALAHGPKMSNQFQQNMNWNSNTNNGLVAQAQTAAVAPPPALSDQQASSQRVAPPPSVMVPASSPAPQPSRGNNEKQDLDSLAVAGRSMVPLQTQTGSAGAEIARAKPATSANAPQSADAGAYALNAEGSNFSPSGTLAPESAQWSINSGGGLQRSMDQGRSWQDIDVNAAHGKGAGVGLQAMRSRDKALAKTQAEPKEKPVIFRAVAANGPDVWAGGSEGNLYHSTDSGAHWVRVMATWRGIELTGDIINLQFSDPQHGRIVTSAAEIWLTMDAGQTWEKH